MERLRTALENLTFWQHLILALLLYIVIMAMYLMPHRRPWDSGTSHAATYPTAAPGASTRRGLRHDLQRSRAAAFSTGRR